MRDPVANPKRENAILSGFARFGGLDQLDWLMILVSVLLGTIAKQTIFWIYPIGSWWVSPFLLMAFGYKVRRKITEVVASRRDLAKDTREE